MTQIQQQRACSDEHIAEARKLFENLQRKGIEAAEETFAQGDQVVDRQLMQCLVEIMAGGVSDDEIRMWRKSPASIYAHQQEAAAQAGIQLVTAKYAGNPLVDQQELVSRDIEAMVGPELSQKLVVPGIDQTVQAEASRLQIMETVAMYELGDPVPVSPRDNHLVHAATLVALLKQKGTPALEQYAQLPPQAQKALELNVNHLGEHLAYATQQGQDKLPAFKPIEDFYKGFKKDLVQVAQVSAQAQAEAELAQQRIRTEGLPAPAPEAATPVTPPPVQPTAPATLPVAA